MSLPISHTPTLTLPRAVSLTLTARLPCLTERACSEDFLMAMSLQQEEQAAVAAAVASVTAGTALPPVAAQPHLAHAHTSPTGDSEEEMVRRAIEASRLEAEAAYGRLSAALPCIEWLGLGLGFGAPRPAVRVTSARPVCDGLTWCCQRWSMGQRCPSHVILAHTTALMHLLCLVGGEKGEG